MVCMSIFANGHISNPAPPIQRLKHSLVEQKRKIPLVFFLSNFREAYTKPQTTHGTRLMHGSVQITLFRSQPIPSIAFSSNVISDYCFIYWHCCFSFVFFASEYVLYCPCMLCYRCSKWKATLNLYKNAFNPCIIKRLKWSFRLFFFALDFSERVFFLGVFFLVLFLMKSHFMFHFCSANMVQCKTELMVTNAKIVRARPH